MAICTRWQRAREPTTWQATVVVVPNAAAQLPQRRGVVGRRRANRRRWTARRAPSSVPRGLPGDIGLLNARDCIVQHYKSHSVELTRTATATQLRSCTDADADGHVTRGEIVRMATDCGIFPESTPASTVTLESRRDMLRC